MTSYSLTSPFAVTDEKELRSLAHRLGAEVLLEDDKFILSGEDLTEYTENDEQVDAVEEFQKLLPDGETVVIKSVNFEEPRFISSYAVLITKHAVADVNLDENIKLKLEGLEEAGN